MEKIGRPVSEKLQHVNVNSSSPVVNSDLSQKLLTKKNESECENNPEEKQSESSKRQQNEKQSSEDPRTDCEALETFCERNEAETNESPLQEKDVLRKGDSLVSPTVQETQKEILLQSSESQEKDDSTAVNETIINISSPQLVRRSNEESCNEDIESNKAQTSSKANEKETDSVESSSNPAGEECCEQRSSGGSKENEAEFVRVADGSESLPAPVNGIEKQTVNGTNKENENNTVAVSEASSPSLANVTKEKVIVTSAKREADENDSLNNSGDESALVIDDRPELDSESSLPLARQSAKTLPASSPQVAPKAPAKSVKGRKTGNPRQPPKFDKEDLEHLRLPEKYGWKRELVYRGTFDQESRKMDIYYHPPSGRKLRSMMDIGTYLDKQVQYPLNRTHFTFRKEKLFEPPFEIVRSAGQPVRAFSSPSVTSKNKGSPTTITPSTGRVVVKVTTPTTPKSTSGVKQTFPGKYINRSGGNVAPKASEKNAGLISSVQQGNSIRLKTNGTGSNLTQLAREALQQSLSPSNQGGGLHSSAGSQTTNLQPNSQQSQPKKGFGFGLKNSKSSSNGASKDRPAVSWKMKVTPRTNIKKNRPRPSSPDWRPSDEESFSSDSSDNEEDENVEIIRHGVGDADGDEIQRVMGPASDLIASIVRQSQPKLPRNTSYSIPLTTVNSGSVNKNLMPRLSTSNMQPPRTKLATSKDPRVMIIQNPSHNINTNANVSLQSVMSRSLLHSSSVPSNLPIQVFAGGYGPIQPSISDVSSGASSIFPPPPPLASCPTLRSTDPPPLRSVGLNPPPLMSMQPPPLLAAPRAPPALQPCPLLLDGNVRLQTPGQMAREIQSQSPPAPPPLAHRSFTPNILQRHGSQKSPQKSGVVPAQAKDTERIEERDIVQVVSRSDEGKKSNQLPKVISDVAELVVSSEEEDNVQCIALSSQAQRKNLEAADKMPSQRKRQTPSFSNSSDEEGPNQATSQAKRIKLEKRKSPEPAQANVKALEAVRNLVANRSGKEDDNKGNGESTQSSTALRNIFNKPPKSKNFLPEANDADKKAGEEEDDDDEFLLPVSFAPEATQTESPQSLSLLNEMDEAEQPVNSTSSSIPSTESTNTTCTSSAASSKSSNSNELALPLDNSHVPLKTNTSNAQLLTLPSALREKLDLKRPLLLSLNGQDITIPPAHVLDTKDSLKVLLPPGTNMSVSGPAKTLSVAVSNLATPSSSSTPPPKLTRGSHLRSSFRPLQECVGFMTRLFKFFSIPCLLKMSQVNRTWLKMFYQPDLWQTVSFRNVYVKDWDQAQRFLQKVCVKKLSLSGMVLRRDIEVESWQRIQKIVPVVTTLTELHFGRVPANVIEGLMEKLPETVNISADLIMDSKSKENKNKTTSNRWSEKHVDNMASALTSVGSGMSSTNAARLFNVAESDLLHLRQDRMYVLTPQEESLVVLCCMRLAQMGFTVTISSFLIKCQEMFARRYSTSVPVPIFDGACRQIFQRNLPFFQCEQGSTPSLPLSLDRHYIKLGNLFDNICRPLKITADQIFMFDIQPFRLLADSQSLSRRVVTLTVLWATDAGSLSVRPAMLVTPTELRSDQTHEKFKAVVAKNGVATPTHIQQYFRQLIASAAKFPLVVLCNTDASNFSESLVSMCLQHQVYLMNIPGDIAKYVFPGCQGGLIHMLKKHVPLMSMKQEEFLLQLKLLFQKCSLNIQMSTKLAFTATGVFPVNRRAPVQYQSHGTSELIGEELIPAAKSKTPISTTTDVIVSKVQRVKIISKASDLEDSSNESVSSEEGEKNENKKSTMPDPSPFSDIEFTEESKESSNISCHPNSSMSKKKHTTEVVQGKNKPSAPQVQSNKKDESKAGEKNHAKDESKKDSKLKNVKNTRFSTGFRLARKLMLKARRGPIKLSTHHYKPLKPLTSVLQPKDSIKVTVDGNNVISTLATNPSVFETVAQHKNSSLTNNLPNKEFSAEFEPKDFEKEPSSLVIDTTKVKEKRSKKSEKSVDIKIKQVLALSPSKNKVLVRKHIQEAIDAVVEESREYARQVEQGGKHGVEIMPEKWIQRQREKQASLDVSSANLNSTYVKKMGDTSIVLKTSSIAKLEKNQDEEEESEEEEEEDVEEMEEDDADEEEAASSNEEDEEEDEVEPGVEWTVSTQPKHVEPKSTRKKHKKRKKKNKRKHYDSDEETSAKDREKKHKKKRAKRAKKKKSKPDPEDMETSHEVSPQKQVLNGNNIEKEAIKNIPSRNDLDSNDKAVTSESVNECEEGHKRNTDGTVFKPAFQQQPSYISDHDYFSKFVDEDSVNMEETDSALPSGTEEMNVLNGVSVLTTKVVLENIPANEESSHQTSTEHDYSKAAEEVLDISGQDVEVEMMEGENSEAKEITTPDSSESDSDSASSHKSSPGTSSGFSKSSNSTGTANEESSEDESDVESEQNKSGVSHELGCSPKKKVRKESSSSRDSDSSGSDSSESDSESEKDEKKKKASTSLESDEEENDDSDEEGEEDKCQLCMRSTPPHSKDVLIDWVDCDKNCGRWFHVICIKNSNFRSKSKSKNPKHYICPSCR